MRIKIITCHDVYNHGASLQAFALQHYLADSGHTVEIIDYKPDYLSGHFSLTGINNPRFDRPIIRWLYIIAKLPERLHSLAIKHSFDRFKKKYLKTTARCYRSNEDLKNSLPAADAFICGSDQIWNSMFRNGTDPAFYLDFVPDNCLKLSYAASFATDDIADGIKPFVKEKVNRLSAISVRESSGIDILSKIGIHRAVQVLDPVFLLPADFWKKEMVQPVAGNYVFVCDFDSSPLLKQIARKIADLKGLKIYSISKNNRYADKNFWKQGPEMFVSLLANARYVVSNSFHATAFAMIFGKPFCVVDRIEAINSRMRDLLKQFDLENRVISAISDLDCLPEIDYSAINPQIEYKTELSKRFLKQVTGE
jgi:hypothetical protein